MAWLKLFISAVIQFFAAKKSIELKEAEALGASQDKAQAQLLLLKQQQAMLAAAANAPQDGPSLDKLLEEGKA